MKNRLCDLSYASLMRLLLLFISYNVIHIEQFIKYTNEMSTDK